MPSYRQVVEFHHPSRHGWQVAGGVMLTVAVLCLVVVFGWLGPSFRAWQCSECVKQLGAVLVFWHAEEHPEAPLPASQGEYAARVRRMVPNASDLVCCVARDGAGYRFNSAFYDVRLEDIREPSRTVLIYEVDSAGSLRFDHLDGMNAAFADGHVQKIDREAVDRFIWAPTDL